MRKNIWIICDNKQDLYETQHIIDDGGAMKAICLPNVDAIRRAIERANDSEGVSLHPSLIIADYDMGQMAVNECVGIVQNDPQYAGVPLIFMCGQRTYDIDMKCYETGATIVLEKPITNLDIVRIERASWQYEMTCNYEKILNRQSAEIKTTKEIRALNEKLATRNKVLQQVFGKYFSDSVVDVILEQPGGDMLGGQKVEVTVLMADLRGFTSMSDSLSADAVVDIIDHFLGEMTKIISDYKGVVIEFIGDEILAVFGAPFSLECSEGNAIAAAICMQNKMRFVNDYNRDHGYPQISMGIGINKGEVFLGNIGSEYMMRYNVIGKTVNLCSRIEGYSTGGKILISEESIKGIEDMLTIPNRYVINPKGFTEDIPICEVTGIGGEYGRIQEVGHDE